MFGIARRIRRNAVKKRQAEDLQQWENVYGEFDKNDYGEYMVTGLPCESEIFHGELIKWGKDLKIKKALFVGDDTKVTALLKEAVGAKEAFCTGLSRFIDVDFDWDFEEEHNIPNKDFDAIFSQAMLEHLIDPYKHMKDLSELVCEGGSILIHTQTPGFMYHRHPIDCLRFHPDWFEAVANKLNLTVTHRRVVHNHIFYVFKK